VTREAIPPVDYYRTIVKYKFQLAPPGAGIQAPKFAEAWALRVVPVTTRYPAFEDLVEQGFPIVIVDKWVRPKVLVASNEELTVVILPYRAVSIGGVSICGICLIIC